MKKKNETQALILHKSCSPEQIKAYFAQVLTLKNTGEEFPVDLDDVWPLLYGRRDEAIRALKNTTNKNGDFLYLEGVDYQTSPQKGQSFDNQVSRISAGNSTSVQDADYQQTRRNAGMKKKAGRPIDKYLLSIPCLEFFVARQVRPVFEVYRQVFHHAVAGSIDILGKQYISRAEYCERLNKSIHSFNGLIPHYKMEFLFINGMWGMSTKLCQAIEMRNEGEKMKHQLRQKSNQLEMSFDENTKKGGVL